MMAWFIWRSDFIPVKAAHFAGTKSTHIKICFKSWIFQPVPLECRTISMRMRSWNFVYTQTN